MKRRFLFGFPLLMLAFVFIGGFVVMLLWNAILPHVISVSALSYWQATGLLVLSRLLFGGFRGGPWAGHRGGPPHWKNRWVNMSDEEKLRMKEEWKKRFTPGA